MDVHGPREPTLISSARLTSPTVLSRLAASTAESSCTCCQRWLRSIWCPALPGNMVTASCCRPDRVARGGDGGGGGVVAAVVVVVVVVMVVVMGAVVAVVPVAVERHR